PYITPGLGFEFHYFFIRKYWFISLARAMIIFPGGFGTMDELFELLTLVQTNKVQRRIPIILFGSEFWNELLNFETFRKWGLIDDADLGLFRIVDTVEEARKHILGQLEEIYGKNADGTDA
ncbi:MAG: LOG family protein, partial [Puniceicoccales bacterium]|nr:LOG family protein [Puniceicoccales bacterium]